MPSLTFLNLIIFIGSLDGHSSTNVSRQVIVNDFEEKFPGERLVSSDPRRNPHLDEMPYMHPIWNAPPPGQSAMDIDAICAPPCQPAKYKPEMNIDSEPPSQRRMRLTCVFIIVAGLLTLVVWVVISAWRSFEK